MKKGFRTVVICVLVALMVLGSVAMAETTSENNKGKSTLDRFKDALSTPNKDANYQMSKKVYEVIKDGNATGKMNTDEFQEAIKYVLGDDWKKRLKDYGDDIVNACEEAEKIAKRYSGQKDDRTGWENFIQDVEKAGYCHYDKKTGDFSIEDFETEEIAKVMKIGNDYITDMFDLLNTYGIDGDIIRWVD